MRYVKWILLAFLFLIFVFHWLWLLNLYLLDEGHLLETQSNCSAAIEEVKAIVRNIVYVTPAFLGNVIWILFQAKSN